jgi:hypothetical protein
MGNSKPGSQHYRSNSWWLDPRVSLYLMITTYVVGGIGIGLGIYGLSVDGAVKGLHYALPLTVGAVGLLAMIRHSVFHESDARRSGVDTEPFYMIELGFANGAMGILALVAFFANWGVAAEVSLALAFNAYLGLAFFLFFARAWKKAWTAAEYSAYVCGFSRWVSCSTSQLLQPYLLTSKILRQHFVLITLFEYRR